MPSVSVRGLSLNFGDVQVLRNLNIDIEEGEFLVLLGPSGCGKSTLLNCIAGLLDASDGQIFIKERNVTWEEPKDRGIGMVFQSYALYPQMSVEGNLSFGLKNARMPSDEITRRVIRAAEILQIEPLLKRKPSQLSGGQRQRVAIGRALVRDVDVFLFDEPLSNLDAQLRSELRVEIKRLHARLKNTMIYVTHDQIEALTLADRIAVMKGGVIQQLAAPQLIYNKPSNLYVAGFIGSPAMNFLPGQIVVSGEEASFTTKDGASTSLQGYEASTSLRQGGEAILGVRPEHIQIHTEPIPGLTIPVTVEIDEPMGADSLLWLKFEQQSLSVRIDADLNCQEGTIYHLEFNIPKSSIFRKDTEERI
ncbi:MAG: ABC transporter ATP-binding protein [Deltaproteobacteria bacterium]|nr:ABC transporter ATP-binding protein [Deltaproteobacteria bacterium]MBT7202934.1 ABC transporter ATP-binding protein [Deltaproteobacteria bacterium]